MYELHYVQQVPADVKVFIVNVINKTCTNFAKEKNTCSVN